MINFGTMNYTHIHLLINHLALFGTLFGGLILTFGFIKKSDSSIVIAYYLFVISALGAVVAYFTGEEAEESIENIQGISHDAISMHEDLAFYAYLATLFLGLLSIIGLWLTHINSKSIRKIALITILVSFISFCLVVRTAYLGGQIRHTELHFDTSDQEEDLFEKNN